MLLSDEKKKRIESLSTKEMAYEINLGRLSHFQRESFAYLKSLYDERISKNNANHNNQEANDIHTTISQKTESNPSTQITKKKRTIGCVSWKKITEGVIIFVVGSLLLAFIYIAIKHFFSLNLYKP